MPNSVKKPSSAIFKMNADDEYQAEHPEKRHGEEPLTFIKAIIPRLFILKVHF
jgi:hypothetical protein